MDNIQIGVIEARFADIIWKNEPVSSTQLVKECEKTLGWKKSTTFTVLKRLCEKGLFINNNGSVSSLISKEDFYAMQSSRFVEESFSGSLPGFLAAFTANKKLSNEDIAYLKKLIKEYGE